MANYPPGTHWRDASRPAKFWMLDANSCFPLVVALLHIAWWTFGLAFIAIVFFALLARKGFTVIIFMRWLRRLIAGPRKIAQPWWL